MHQPQLDAAKVAGSEDYDFTNTFQMVKPLIKKADLAFGNLELTFPGHPPYKGWPSFRSPDALATALYDAGFDVLTTANNHSNDGRTDGTTQYGRRDFFRNRINKNEKSKNDHYGFEPFIRVSLPTKNR